MDRTPILIILVSFWVTVSVLQEETGSASGTGLDLQIPTYQANAFEYGLHFDEPDDPNFGSYDYNYPGDQDEQNDSVYLRGTVRSDMYYSKRYRYGNDPIDNYQTLGVLQIYQAGAWRGVAGFDVHMLHLFTLPAAWQYTPAIRWQNDSWYTYFGTICRASRGCGTSFPHVHFSMELDGTGSETQKTDDTCWASGSQCHNYTSYMSVVDEHVECDWSYDDNGASYRSGVISPDYICEQWSKENRGSNSNVFNVP